MPSRAIPFWTRPIIQRQPERPVTVLSRMKETPLACADLGVSATLDELRDAGWRVVSLDIGEDSESEQYVGFPVTVMIRKLF